MLKMQKLNCWSYFIKNKIFLCIHIIYEQLWNRRKLEHCKQEEEATLPPLFLTSNNTGKTTSLSCKKIDELAL